MDRHRNLKVLARFRPRVVEDLMPGLAKVIGADSVFTYTRQMDEDEPLPGEWILKTDDDRFGDYWIPECDLQIIKQYPGRRSRH
jgi:hypothetical protein